MQEQRARQSHLSTKHTCTDASAVCQVSAPLPKEVKLQKGWKRPGAQWRVALRGAEELQPEQSHSHSSLSRASECKRPVSQIQQGKGHGQPLKERSGSQLRVRGLGTPCAGHSVGSYPPEHPEVLSTLEPVPWVLLSSSSIQRSIGANGSGTLLPHWPELGQGGEKLFTGR